MNHLAHCYLSFGDADLLLGNFIADFVKGRRWEAYPQAVQRGILLHRAIDSFTDDHPAVKQSTARARPYAGRYAGPVVDILYDFLLAEHWTKVTSQPFDRFVRETYNMLETRRLEMPDPLRERLPRMLAGDFLRGYARLEGLDFVLERFSRRLPPGMDWLALKVHFLTERSRYSEDFLTFFPLLEQHGRDFL
ncbi:MAG: ACP phosphodiesterase [Saprospiraceae bacterium]